MAGGSVYYFWGRLSLKLPIAAVSFKTKKLLITSQFLLLIGVISSLLICAFFDTLLGMFLFFICVVVWYGKVKGPQLIHDYQKNKVQTQMSELFPQTLGMCIQALKTGQTIPQVLEYLSHECSQPLRTEITAVCTEMSLGLSAEAALDKMAERFPNFSEFHQFLESYKITRQNWSKLDSYAASFIGWHGGKEQDYQKNESHDFSSPVIRFSHGSLTFYFGAGIFDGSQFDDTANYH